MMPTKSTERPSHGSKIVSRTEATVFMLAAALAAVVTTFFSLSEIAGYFTGPVTLELPVGSTGQTAGGLGLESSGHYTTLAATIPALPSGPAALLAWSAALHQIGVLAVLLLVFLLAHRLRSSVLFIAGSAWVIGASGAVLMLAGTVGQVLHGFALTRVAELVAVAGRPADEMVLFEGDLSAGPLVLGAVLMLVAGAFQYGRRLQQDTQGLV